MGKPVRRLPPILLLLVLLAPCAAPAQQQVNPDQLRPPFNDPRAARHWTRDRAYDLQHVKLELGIDWEKREIAGTATLTLAPLNDGLTRVTLDAAELTIEAVTTSGGGKLDFAAGAKELTVVLDRAYSAGEAVTLAIRYRARPRKGFYFVAPDQAYPTKPRQAWTQGESEYNHYWFPSYDFPNDKATSETIVAVPAEMIVIGNGRLVEVRENPAAKTKTYHWREEVPHSTYLISLVAGRFDRHVDMLGELPVEYYVPPGTDAATVKRSFALTPEMIRFFADYSATPYPYERYAQDTVEEFLWGGMENISATTLYTDTLHDEAAAPNWSSEGLVAHELAHQWWGDWLTCRDWSHLWLNESFATFFTNLWFERRLGRDEYDYRVWENWQDYFEEDRKDYRRPIVMPVYVDEMDLFDEHTYPKGAAVLAMLRAVVGDEEFQKSIRHYAAKHARQPVDTEDFRKAIAEATGQDLGWFFDEWLYRAGHPEFAVTSEWDEPTRTAHLVVEQKQALKEMTPIFRMLVEIEFTTAAGAQTFRVEVAHARDDFYFPLAARPTRVRFDPGQKIIKKLEFAKSREELTDLATNDPNVAGRIWAAQQLAERAGDLVALATARDVLLQDRFYGVRLETAKALGKTHSAVARDALIEALRDPDARVREAAAEALGEFAGDATAAAALEGVVRSEPKVYVVAAALKSLGKMQAPKAFETLRSALGRDSHRDVIRQKALEGLAELGDAPGLPLALEWARYGRPPRAREAAIEALGKLGRGDDNVFRYLTSLLADPYVWARRAALTALGELGDARALPTLEAFAANEIERRLQREAEIAIDKLRRAQAAKRTADDLAREVETLKQEVRTLREKAAAPPR